MLDESLHSVRPAPDDSAVVLTDVQRFILGLMVEGYTVPAIIDRLRRRVKAQVESGDVLVDDEVPYADIVRMYQDHYTGIREERALREKDFKDRGLGTRVGRAQRLEKLAEQLEPHALRTPSFARAYADVIAKLDAIMLPEEKSHIPESDEWMQHLKRLSQLPMPSLMPPELPEEPTLVPVQIEVVLDVDGSVESSTTSWGTQSGSTQ